MYTHSKVLGLPCVCLGLRKKEQGNRNDAISRRDLVQTTPGRSDSKPPDLT